MLGSRQLDVSTPIQRYSVGVRGHQEHFVDRKQYSVLEATDPSKEGRAPIKQEVSRIQRVVNFDDDQGIFYKPQRPGLRVINEVTASKQTITNKAIDKQESKGSIYRQFSDTRILKLLRQPHKTKVDLMRNRYRGQHFKH